MRDELRFLDRLVGALAAVAVACVCFAWGSLVSRSDERARRAILIEQCPDRLAAEILRTGELLCMSGSARARR